MSLTLTANPTSVTTPRSAAHPTSVPAARGFGRLVLETPIGRIGLAGTDDALTRVVLPNELAASDLPSTATGDDNPPVGRAVAVAACQLVEYFGGTRTTFDIPLAFHGTPFQEDVWRALGEIPYAETITYAELAALVGRPRAYRAVGQANGANPIPIVLPCHRVLAAGGRIGGYGGGLPTKQRLLTLEGVTLV
jgi:methylated-DNA-[protein]-cysteine S-methyltransferase